MLTNQARQCSDGRDAGAMNKEQPFQKRLMPALLSPNLPGHLLNNKRKMPDLLQPMLPPGLVELLDNEIPTVKREAVTA